MNNAKWCSDLLSFRSTLAVTTAPVLSSLHNSISSPLLSPYPLPTQAGNCPVPYHTRHTRPELHWSCLLVFSLLHSINSGAKLLKYFCLSTHSLHFLETAHSKPPRYLNPHTQQRHAHEYSSSLGLYTMNTRGGYCRWKDVRWEKAPNHHAIRKENTQQTSVLTTKERRWVTQAKLYCVWGDGDWPSRSPHRSNKLCVRKKDLHPPLEHTLCMCRVPYVLSEESTTQDLVGCQ